MARIALKPTGTTKGICTWLRQQRFDESSRIDLYALPLESPALVVTWPSEEAARDPDAWADLVIGMAQDDADARGVTTKYELRHMRGDRQVGVMPLRRCVESTSTDEEDAPQPVTDVGSMMATMARMLDQSHRQVIEASKVAMQSAASANETQRASLAMLSQAYTIIATQQNALAIAAEERREAMPSAPAEKTGMAKAGDEAAQMLMGLAVQKYGPAIIEKFLGPMMSDENPTN